MDAVPPPETLRVVVNFLCGRWLNETAPLCDTHGAAEAPMVGTNDKRQGFFGELACYMLAVAPF